MVAEKVEDTAGNQIMLQCQSTLEFQWALDHSQTTRILTVLNCSMFFAHYKQLVILLTTNPAGAATYGHFPANDRRD